MNSLKIDLGVFRRLDNRFEHLPDESPRGVELHVMRKEALHEALDGDDEWTVEDWGLTDDTDSHEFVEILLSVASNPQVHHAVIAGLGWVGVELAKAGIDEFAKQAVTKLLSRLIDKQKEHKFLNFSLKLSVGAKIFVSRESEVSVDLDESAQS
jgi:hypothetical protein